jgi:hypothetical protein
LPPLFRKYSSLSLMLIAFITSCNVSLWNGDLQSFVEEGVSTITVSSYDNDYIPSDTISALEIDLINPMNLEGNYVLEEVSTTYLDNEDYSFDASSAESDKKLYLTVNPDSTAEQQSLTLSLDITAMETGRRFDTIYLTIPCDTAPNDVYDTLVGTSTTNAYSEVAFTLPSESTDNDLAYIEISYNITDSSDTTIVTLAADEELYKSTQREEDLDISPTESDYLRYYSPPEASPGASYEYFIVLIDEAGQRSSEVPGSSGTLYYMVTYETNGGYWNNDPGTDYVTNSVTLPSDDDITSPDGYSLGGWSDGSNTYSSSETVTISTETTFTAQWENTGYEISYYSDDDSYAVSYTNTDVLLSSAGDLGFDESGYTFVGWSTDEVDSIGAEATLTYYDVDDDEDDYFTIEDISNDVSLYAVWIPDTGTAIRTNGELETMNSESSWSSDYYLCRDLDLSSDYTHAPIGDSSASFSNSFYGWNHTLSNLTMESDSTYYGFFGKLEGTVTDLIIKDAYLEANDNEYIGILTGYLSGTVEDCQITGTSSDEPSTISSYGYAGGIAGYATSATISGCTVSNLSLSDSSSVGTLGGITGYAYSSTFISNSVSSFTLDGGTGVGDYCGGQIGSADDCTITIDSTDSNTVSDFTLTNGGNACGGLIGYAYSVMAEDCILSNINLSIDGYRVGGVVGHMGFADDTTLSSILSTDGIFNSCHITTININATNSGDTSEPVSAGGFVGYADFSSVTSSSYNVLENCSVTLNSESSIYGDDDYVGGFAGYVVNGSLYNCSVDLTDSMVSGNYGTGGFIGTYLISETDDSFDYEYQIDQCYVSGNGSVAINSGSDNKCVGGFIGFLNTDDVISTPTRKFTITECYSYATVSGDSTNTYVGGLLGAAYDADAALEITIDYSYFRGSFSGFSETPYGLLGGTNTALSLDVDYCYTAAEDSGSAVGLFYDSTATEDMNESYYQLDSGSVESFGTGASSSEMTDGTTLSIFLSETNWSWDSATNDSYPYLTNLSY